MNPSTLSSNVLLMNKLNELMNKGASKADIFKTIKVKFDLTKNQESELTDLYLEARRKRAESKDPREFFRNYVEAQELNYVFASDTFHKKDGESISSDVLLAHLNIDARSLGVNVEDIPSAFVIFKDEKRKEAIADVLATIAFDESKRERGENEIRKFVEICSLTPEINHLHIQVIKHFIWQMKNKLRGRVKRVEKHMMLVLEGKQGGGKTEAIKKLIAPVKPVANINGQFSIYTDSREYFIRNKYFCIFLDELQKAENSEIEAIKNGITSEEISYRLLGINMMVSCSNNHVAIGATNSTLSKVIRDSTGARRFWRMLTKKVLDWLAINSLDYQLMWQSVSEDDACPVLENWNEIEKIQDAQIRSRTSVENYVDEINAQKSEPVKRYSKELYQEYVDYCKEANCGNPFSRNNFYDELSKLEIERKEDKGGYYYMLKRFSSVTETDVSQPWKNAG